jgi:hypothetical protein
LRDFIIWHPGSFKRRQLSELPHGSGLSFTASSVAAFASEILFAKPRAIG